MQHNVIFWLLFNRYKQVLLEFILPVALLLLFFILELKDYFQFSITSIFGIVLIPFVINCKNPTEKSNRYFYIMVGFLSFAYFAPINTLIYLAWISAFLFLIENHFGKTGILSFIYLIVISPIFLYFGNFFGIPARLELTELASKLLNAIDFQNQVAGNLIITQNNEFSVDPACMGLTMLSTSFLLAIVIAMQKEKETYKKLTLLSTFLYLGLVLLYNLSGNLIRILLLVIFHIPAEDYMHDEVGILCLIVYVLIPLYFTANLLYKKHTISLPIKNVSLHKSTNFLNYIAILLMLGLGYYLKININRTNTLPANCSIEGYTKTIAAKDVLKFEDASTLIYVKPVNSFYGAEHTPMICWVGSGYSFQQVKKIKISNIEIFYGRLSKGKDIIYCSWWFDNGENKTINQLIWRWDVIKGAKNYSLININTKDEKTLYTKTSEIISKNIF